ncbi:hypothetical protein RchiOBHm_Chr3g0467241 [Rosa chinensis]|uniref:Transmembrane protein n=1 Tax=Rosa chinensis TaxID=74649 RepID=A0A2P6RA71_ROSCH|nr:hypothetical protein RchiOBHm_Chr3g0467241 [Rosa chinensis]
MKAGYALLVWFLWLVVKIARQVKRCCFWSSGWWYLAGVLSRDGGNDSGGCKVEDARGIRASWIGLGLGLGLSQVGLAGFGLYL